ncbi:universal stress protein [Lapidilactobacillus salsurivasis]
MAEVDRDPEVYFHKMLVAVDDSEDSKLAFKYAVHRAKKDHLGLAIVSILESDEMNVYQAFSNDYVHGEREDLERHLEEYRHEAEDAGVEKVETFIGEGKPGDVIVHEAIPTIKPDLLIIGARAKTTGARVGSQAAYMVKHARISVAVIRK